MESSSFFFYSHMHRTMLEDSISLISIKKYGNEEPLEKKRGNPCPDTPGGFCHSGCCQLQRANGFVIHLNIHQSIEWKFSNTFFSICQARRLPRHWLSSSCSCLLHFYWSIWARAATPDYALMHSNYHMRSRLATLCTYNRRLVLSETCTLYTYFKCPFWRIACNQVKMLFKWVPQVN